MSIPTYLKYDPRLLQKVCPDTRPNKTVPYLTKTHFQEFSKAATVVIADGFRIAKALQ